MSETLSPVMLAPSKVASVNSLTSLAVLPCWKNINEASVYSVVVFPRALAASLASLAKDSISAVFLPLTTWILFKDSSSDLVKPTALWTAPVIWFIAELAIPHLTVLLKVSNISFKNLLLCFTLKPTLLISYSISLNALAPFTPTAVRFFSTEFNDCPDLDSSLLNSFTPSFSKFLSKDFERAFFKASADLYAFWSSLSNPNSGLSFNFFIKASSSFPACFIPSLLRLKSSVKLIFAIPFPPLKKNKVYCINLQ